MIALELCVRLGKTWAIFRALPSSMSDEEHSEDGEDDQPGQEPAPDAGAESSEAPAVQLKVAAARLNCLLAMCWHFALRPPTDSAP